MTDRYIDPNSGAAPQPGGYSGLHQAPVDEAGNFDTAVADEVTEQQEHAEQEHAEQERVQAKKAAPAKKAAAKKAAAKKD